jgi:hypothetical protein
MKTVAFLAQLSQTSKRNIKIANHPCLYFTYFNITKGTFQGVVLTKNKIWMITKYINILKKVEHNSLYIHMGLMY